MSKVQWHRPDHRETRPRVTVKPIAEGAGMTARRPPRRPRRGDLISELQRNLRPVARPNILVLLWRWRWELGLLLCVPTALTVLITRLGWMWSLTAIGITAVTFEWPDARYWLIAHVRCIITAHRVRTGCAQAWIQSRYGKLPIILLTRPQPYGERVYIWCRAGICLEDFEAASDILRSACWASDIYVTSSTRHSHVVILDVIRYQWID